MEHLRWSATLALVAGLWACGPIERFPGGRLRGEVVAGPVEDWSFSDEHATIQLETRPSFPHSITTWCFTHEGDLYVPSGAPTQKKWPFFVLEDPHVRLKIGDRIYLGRAHRVTDEAEIEALVPSLVEKYTQLAGRSRGEREVWFFRIDPT